MSGGQTAAAYDRAYALGLSTGALAALVPLSRGLVRGLREASLLVFPLIDGARPIFVVLFVALAFVTILLCLSAWRRRPDRPLVVLGVLTGFIFLITVLAPTWWDLGQFFDYLITLPTVAFTTYAVAAMALSLNWFIRRRPAFKRPA